MSKTSLTLLLAASLAACAAAPEKPQPCAGYCQSREEGYDWARRANLLDDSACRGYAAAFVEGCQQSVQDYQNSVSPRTGF